MTHPACPEANCTGERQQGMICDGGEAQELKGMTNMAIIPAVVPLQAFQMSSPAAIAYSFDRAVPRAAAVVLECEIGAGERSISRDRVEIDGRGRALAHNPPPPPARD